MESSRLRYHTLCQFPDGLIGLIGSYNSASAEKDARERNQRAYPYLKYTKYEADTYNEARAFVIRYNNKKRGEAELFKYHIVQKGAPLNRFILRWVGSFTDPNEREIRLLALRAEFPQYQFGKLDNKTYQQTQEWVNAKNLEQSRKERGRETQD